MGTGIFTLGVKCPERESDQSPPSTSGVKNSWGYTTISHTSSSNGA